MTVTWNPSDTAPNITLSNGNRTATSAIFNTWETTRATVSHNSGKQYVEFVWTVIHTNPEFGLATGDGTLSGNRLSALGATASFQIDTRTSVFGSEGSFSFIGGFSTLGFTTNDVLGVAVDITNGNLWLAKNNNYTVFGAAGSNPSTLTTPVMTFTPGLTLFPGGSVFQTNDAILIQGDTANQSFSPPTNFVAWGGAAATTVFRRSLSALGTRTGSRQGIIF